MQLKPDDIYLRLGQMVANMPELDGPYPVTREINEWVARALALVELQADSMDVISMKSAMRNLNGILRQNSAQAISAIVFSEMARAELRASPEIQGQFIGVSSPHQAFVAVGNVLRIAKLEVMIVDAYADSTALSDFAIQTNQGVAVRLLTDRSKRKPDLEPAVRRWREEHADLRPLMVATADPSKLHDRIIILDGRDVWGIGQSLNGIGKKSPTAIFRIPDHIANEKITAYESIWNASQQI